MKHTIWNKNITKVIFFLTIFYSFSYTLLEVVNLNLSDSFFNRVEKKTNVKKETILDLAKKLQGDNMKNEDNLRDVIKELSFLTGKTVSKEQEDKIVNTVINDKIPKDIDKMI